MSTAPCCVDAKLVQFSNRTTELSYCAGRQQQTEQEPQDCLYTLSREVAFPKLGKLELIAFSFFGVLASAATIYCFAELSHVINGGMLEQTVHALLSR